MGVIESVAEALHAACLRDLPAIEYLTHDQGQERQYLNGLSEADRKSYYESKRKVSESDRALSAFYAERGIHVFGASRRPSSDACQVYAFRQTWPTTSLGYGGISGQAFTKAYTVVVLCEESDCAAVYFGSAKLAYLIPSALQQEAFQHYLSTLYFPSCWDAKLHGWYPFLEVGEVS